MVNLTQIELGLMNYIEAEIMAKATPINKFLIGTAVGLVSPKAEKTILQYAAHPMAKTLEIVDAEGFVDLEKLHAAAKDAYKKSGSFAVAGIILDDTDIDKIYEHIKSAVV